MLDNNIQNIVSTSTASMTTHLSRIKQEGAQVASLAESAASNTTSIAAQSALTGESFTDSLKSQYQNIVIGALANVAAKEIGSNYKTSGKTATDRTIQLASHAALGCASASAAGGDCASGAVAGVVGELAAEYAKDSLYPDQNVASLTHQQKTNIKELAGLAGGFSAIFTGNLAGLDDSEVAENIFSGQRIGKNAAANNYLSPKEKGSLVKELNDCGDDSSCRESVQEKYEKISDPRDEEFTELYDDCKKNGNCTEFEKIHYDLRMQWTEEGNEYFWEHVGEFTVLDSDKSIYHTFELDENGAPSSIFGRSNNIKYVHPVYGYEIVIDQNNQIVSDPVNMGTYNFYNSNMGIGNNLIEDEYGGILGGVFGNHNKYDVKPYNLLGNTATQTSIPSIARNLEILNPKINSDD